MASAAAALTASEKPRLFLVDGSGFIFRAYHSLPPLTRPDGTPVGAVFGYTNMLLKLVDDLEADYLAVIFDAARKNFRNDIYPEYKAHRPEAPEDLVPQFPLIREATAAFNIPCIEMEGFEADDLIATYAKLAKQEGMEVVIVSSDKDLMQLVDDDVLMFDSMKDKLIGREQVIEKFGVPPEKVVEAQALIGDSTDNVPGVPGIGPKTAAELISTFGDLEGVLSRTDEIKQKKRKESLVEFADQARISRQLVLLKDDVEVPSPLKDFETKDPEAEKVIPFLKEQGFRALLAKYEKHFDGVLPKQAGGESAAVRIAVQQPESASYELVQTEAQLKAWLERIEKIGSVAVDTETTSLDAKSAELVGISLCCEAGKACYIPVGHRSGGGQQQLFGDDLPANDVKQIPRDRVLALLQPMLEDPAILKIGQNIKYDMLVLKQYGIQITPVDDTMVLSYVLDSGQHKHNMDELAKLFLDYETIPFSAVAGSGKSQISFAEVALDKALDYAAEDADVTWRLHQVLKERLVDERMTTVYERLERPLIPVLVAMENTGIRVDLSVLQKLSAEFESKLSVLEQEIYKLAGREFTIGSPKQLGEILYDELKLEGGKKSSKSGAYATGAEILEELAVAGHEIAKQVLKWRQISKLKSTYSDALAKQINPKTGRVHTSYAMAVTSTGRLSSSDPNLQNIPIRTEEGRSIRSAFVAEKGTVLLSADYSQIELRLLAHVAGIDSLKSAFKEGRDIHATTASQMFGVPLEEVDSELRRKAKTINFGIIYGISAFGLSARLGIGRKEAAEFIEMYFRQYPGIRKYMDDTKEFCKKHGYVETLFGRKCHIPGITDKNPNRRNFAERAAINAPLQGTAADIIKRAMIALPHALAEHGLQSRPLLQVHDELVLEVPESEIEQASSVVKRVMESAAHLSIPLTVEVGYGTDWNQAH